MCIYYLISFTKSIYFLLNFQIPFMFWIIILPLNILYYPTNESIRFSNNLIFLTVLKFGLIWGAVLGISAVSATFSRVFPGFWAGFWVLFLGFLQFQLLFLGFSQAFGLGLGAVLEVLEITAPQVLPTVCAINLWLLNIMLI